MDGYYYRSLSCTVDYVCPVEMGTNSLIVENHGRDCVCVLLGPAI